MLHIRTKRDSQIKFPPPLLTYLNSVGVIGRVFEESIVRIEHLSRDDEEEFSGWTPVVEAFLFVEGDVKARLGQLLLGGGHHLLEGIL